MREEQQPVPAIVMLCGAGMGVGSATTTKLTQRGASSIEEVQQPRAHAHAGRGLNRLFRSSGRIRLPSLKVRPPLT